MRFLEERKIKDNTKKRKYIQDTEKDAKGFSEDDLIKEIRLAKLNLYELKGKSKTTFNQVITFLLSILTVAGSWIILYGDISNGLSNFIDFVNKHNNNEPISIDVIQNQAESLKESLLGTIDLTSRTVIFGGITISICIIVLVYELIQKSDIADEIAKTELKIEIYTDILNNKQYKSDSGEECDSNNKIKIINEYKEKFGLLLSQYKNMNLTNEELEKEKCVINAEIERIKYYKTEYKKKDYFEKYMSAIAIVLAFYGLLISALDLKKYEMIANIMVIIPTIVILYFLYRANKKSKKEENIEEDANNMINTEKELFINLNIELQVIEYLTHSKHNKKVNEQINNKEILKEVVVDKIDK